jgi:hypothetical protein
MEDEFLLCVLIMTHIMMSHIFRSIYDRCWHIIRVVSFSLRRKNSRHILLENIRLLLNQSLNDS